VPSSSSPTLDLSFAFSFLEAWPRVRVLHSNFLLLLRGVLSSRPGNRVHSSIPTPLLLYPVNQSGAFSTTKDLKLFKDFISSSSKSTTV